MSEISILNRLKVNTEVFEILPCKFWGKTYYYYLNIFFVTPCPV